MSIWIQCSIPPCNTMNNNMKLLMKYALIWNKHVESWVGIGFDRFFFSRIGFGWWKLFHLNFIRRHKQGTICSIMKIAYKYKLSWFDAWDLSFRYIFLSVGHQLLYLHTMRLSKIWTRVNVREGLKCTNLGAATSMRWLWPWPMSETIPLPRV